MIDVAYEQPITLGQAAKLLPHRRRGKPTHPSCVYRWTKDGLDGIKLDFIQVGGTRCTSREALSRFFERLTAARIGAPPPTRTAAQRERDIARAENELKEAGL